tara:strand:- start:38 stop:478 length:441 start_codon:yes stop_codon:yes gene_type:complete
MQISPVGMFEDVAAIAEEQKAIGYESTLIEGAAKSDTYMKSLFDDWQAEGITSVLHEKNGGYANNAAAIYGLAAKAEAAGARIISGITVTGFQSDGGSITAIETDRGRIGADQVIVAAGPWVKTIWDMLDLPDAIETCSTCPTPSR